MQWNCSWVCDSLDPQARPPGAEPTESRDFLFTIFTLRSRGYNKQSWTCTSNVICILRLPIVNCNCLGNCGFPRVNHDFTIVPTLVPWKSFAWVDFAHPPFGHPVLDIFPTFSRNQTSAYWSLMTDHTLDVCESWSDKLWLVKSVA